MKKKRGFTLIEVIAVLVILAIITLIVTPLVMNIIRKAKDSANKRSIDAYARSVEYAVAAYMLDDTEFPTSFDDITIEYRGSKVECAVNVVNYDGSIFLDKCAVNGKLVKDSKFSSGYYQVGKDTGNYMFTLYKDVTEVINNSSGSVSGNASSTGNNGSTSNSTLGTVTYNGLSYYRLPNVRVTAGYVALVSEEPLSYEDTIKYAGNIPVANVNGFGMVAYYSSDTCNASNTEGCRTDYASSNVKEIIDAWAKDNVNSDSTATIMTTEYLTNYGYALVGNNVYSKTSSTPNSLFELGVDYWAIDDNGNVYKGSSTFNVTYPYDVASIRPIIIAKASDVKNNKPATNGNNINYANSANSVTNNTVNDTVKNPYTVDFIIMFISIAVIVVCVIIYIIYMITKNKKENNKNVTN